MWSNLRSQRQKKVNLCRYSVISGTAVVRAVSADSRHREVGELQEGCSLWACCLAVCCLPVTLLSFSNGIKRSSATTAAIISENIQLRVHLFAWKLCWYQPAFNSLIQFPKGTVHSIDLSSLSLASVMVLSLEWFLNVAVSINQMLMLIVVPALSASCYEYEDIFLTAV